MKMPDKPSDDLAFGRAVIESEMRALQGLAKRLDGAFQRAVDMLFGCTGRVVVTGIGKAGLIGQKISATLASTGTPSYSLHPVDAIHGDLGRIVEGDVVLALSNSGETEVVQVLKAVKRMGARVIAVTGNPQSTLAKQADVVLDIGTIEEPCPLGLAPSASTTAMLALGDALALAVANRQEVRQGAVRALPSRRRTGAEVDEGRGGHARAGPLRGCARQRDGEEALAAWTASPAERARRA